MAQNEEIFEDALTLWKILDHNELLDKHQHLLNMGDGQLGKYTILRCRQWIVDAGSTIEAKSKQQQQQQQFAEVSTEGNENCKEENKK